MLLAATFVPQTLLLVPGAAGRADVLTDVRLRALEATRALVTGMRDVPDGRLVLVAPAGPAAALASGPELRTAMSLGALGGFGAPGSGVDAVHLGWPPASPQHPSVAAHSGGDTLPEGAAVVVGARLLAEAGWAAAVDVVTTAPTGQHDDGGAAARAAGARLAEEPGHVGLLVVGSLGVRGTHESVWAFDPEAGEVDDQLLSDLAAPDDDGLARLAGLDERVAGRLGIGAWGPWQVAVGAAASMTGAPALAGEVLAQDATLGARHVVARWSARAGR